MVRAHIPLARGWLFLAAMLSRSHGTWLSLQPVSVGELDRVTAGGHSFKFLFQNLARAVVRHRLKESYFLRNLEGWQAPAAMSFHIPRRKSSVPRWHDKGLHRLP